MMLLILIKGMMSFGSDTIRHKLTDTGLCYLLVYGHPETRLYKNYYGYIFSFSESFVMVF